MEFLKVFLLLGVFYKLSKTISKGGGNLKYIELLNDKFGEFDIYNYEDWNKEYEGLIIKTKKENIKIRCRLAKKTPKKSGYFVAFWEKNSFQKNEPFKEKNSPELLAICILDEVNQGVFVIPKEGLVKNNILANVNNKGKMAARFYPSWSDNLNKTAKKTQDWQLEYFYDYTM